MNRLRKKFNFAMPEAGHIHVTVLNNSDSIPVSQVQVCPWWSTRDKKKNGNEFQSGFCSETDSNGEVVLDVTAGANKVSVFNEGNGGVGGISCYYNNKSDFDSAEVVNVAAGATESITFHINGPNACGSGDIGEI
jgi:hypothetical protein